MRSHLYPKLYGSPARLEFNKCRGRLFATKHYFNHSTYNNYISSLLQNNETNKSSPRLSRRFLCSLGVTAYTGYLCTTIISSVDYTVQISFCLLFKVWTIIFFYSTNKYMLLLLYISILKVDGLLPPSEKLIYIVS